MTDRTFSTVPLALAPDLLERFGRSIVVADAIGACAEALPLGWPAMDEVLPAHGLPRGVIELRAPHALGGGTSIALAAVRAAQMRDPRAWCAWIDPGATLYAGGAAMAGIDLGRLAVIQPSRRDLPRIAIKTARSQAFDVIVVDVDPVPGARLVDGANPPTRRPRTRDTLDVFVRKLALLAADGGATVLLLTDGNNVRPSPLPVALRLELARHELAIGVRVGKERHGRVGLAKTVPCDSRPGLELVG